MDESLYGTERPTGNGNYVEVTDGAGEDDQPKGYYSHHHHHQQHYHGGGGGGAEETLYSVFHRFISAILFPDHGADPAPLLHRIKTSVAHNAPLLREAAGNTSRNVLIWTRRGSPFRALLVISVSLFFLSSLQCYKVSILLSIKSVPLLQQIPRINKRQIIKHIEGIHSTTKTPS